MRQLLLQNATVILLQNATEVLRKMCQVLGHLLLIVTILLQNVAVITKCNVNYKLRQYIYITKVIAVMKRSIYINKLHKHQKIDKT